MLVDVVVEAVVKAVDVSKPTVPACPLAITYPSLSEARHPTTIDMQSVADVEVLYLNQMLTGIHSIRDVLILADGGKG
jgi:hypothetical protein